ncbi:MAG: isochorismatase [Longimicrobiales bacterium]
MTLLPIPPYFDPASVGRVWPVDYVTREAQARVWAGTHNLGPASADNLRICLMLIDCQNTFCTPDYELFVAGRSGTGAVDDTVRLCEFVYRHLHRITWIVATLDTHTAVQIFHPVFWIDQAGEHPTGAATVITVRDIEDGVWTVNPAVAGPVAGGDAEFLRQHALHYARMLEKGRYPLMIWPYHAMLGSVGHALVSAVEEALFFHGVARETSPRFETKGDNPLTENYSVLRPEVITGPNGAPIGAANEALVDRLADFDAVIVAGQAKSHCVAWTAADLLRMFSARDAALPERVYLLEDCTSPVVVPGVVDFTEQAEAMFRELAAGGMRVVRSTDPMEAWGGILAGQA